MSEFRLGIRRPATGERKYIRLNEGRGHFAHMRLQLDPRPGEKCRLLTDASVALPEKCVEAARAALLRRIAGSPGAFPLHGFTMTITGGSWMKEYSIAEAFTIAAEMALADGLQAAGQVVLEPWVGVRLRVDEGALAVVMRGLTQMFGEVPAEVSWSHYFVLKTEVPLRVVHQVRAMFGLESALSVDHHVPELFALTACETYREVPVGFYQEWTGELEGWT